MNGTFRALSDSAEFVVDAQGGRKALLLDYAVWKKLMDQTEDMEDSAEIEASRTSGEETVPCEQAKAELRSKGINV